MSKPTILVTSPYRPNDLANLGLPSAQQGIRGIFKDDFSSVRVLGIDAAEEVLDEEEFDVMFTHLHGKADYEQIRRHKRLVELDTGEARLMYFNPENLDKDVTYEAFQFVDFPIMGPLSTAGPIIKAAKTLAEYSEKQDDHKLVYRVDDYPSVLEKLIRDFYVSLADEDPSFTFAYDTRYTLPYPLVGSANKDFFTFEKKECVLLSSRENYMRFECGTDEGRAYLFTWLYLLKKRGQAPRMSVDLLLEKC